MLVSSLARKKVACLFPAVAIPGTLIAQSGYLAAAGPVAIAGYRPGDQVRPQLSLSPSGGYLVWQDNATDPAGLGVSALALDAGFNGVGAAFRVNQRGAGDQERPRVSLINNGGSAFLWQTRIHPGFYNVYARFLSSSNTWLTGDMQVNAGARNFLRPPEPALATLTTGNVAIVWASFNQLGATSMQDIFAQIFTSSGRKIGSEFLVNEFTPFNQRSPAIAPLATGGFVVAWVSEQQRIAPDAASTNASITPTGQVANRASVDVYARIYDASAAPVGDEFLVNTGSDICANPSVVGLPDGGFLIAWGQKDLQVRTNSWDVFARSFSGSGAGGDVRRVNTWVFGDQMIPQLSAAGTNCLAVWTSLGQDGCAEGVYAQFLQLDGSPVGGEFRLNTTTVGSYKQPALASDSLGRFLAVWTTFTPSSHSFDLFARSYAQADFVPVVASVTYGPPPAETFIDGAPQPREGTPAYDAYVSAIATGPTLDFHAPDAAAANAALSQPFARAQGTYNGLFYDANGVSARSSGYVTVRTTARGAYTARLVLGGRAYSLLGMFNASTGLATNIIRQGSSVLTVQLQLDLVAGNQISGHITDGHWWADLMADRQDFGRANPAKAFAGTYTMLLPPAADGPAGTGFGTLNVDAAGNVQWSGSLADGTSVSQTSALSDQGIWPLFSTLYGGAGSLIGWIQFSGNGDFGGPLIWVKPASPSAKYYPQGFTNEIKVAGSLYRRPAPRARVLSLNSGGRLVFSGAGLSGPFTNAFALDLNNRLISSPGSRLSLSLSLSSGLFRGSTFNPETGKLFPFQGALSERDSMGAGFFLGASTGGQVYLLPAP
jgi:hypothetical protein